MLSEGIALYDLKQDIDVEERSSRWLYEAHCKGVYIEYSADDVHGR